MSEYVIGITGASGSIYGIRLIQELAGRKHSVHVVPTSAGKAVIREELEVDGFAEFKNSATRAWSSPTPKRPSILGRRRRDPDHGLPEKFRPVIVAKAYRFNLGSNSESLDGRVGRQVCGRQGNADPRTVEAVLFVFQYNKIVTRGLP